MPQVAAGGGIRLLFFVFDGFTPPKLRAIGSLPPGGGATLRTLTLLGGGGLTPLAFSSTL